MIVESRGRQVCRRCATTHDARESVCPRLRKGAVVDAHGRRRAGRRSVAAQTGRRSTAARRQQRNLVVARRRQAKRGGSGQGKIAPELVHTWRSSGRTNPMELGLHVRQFWHRRDAEAQEVTPPSSSTDHLQRELLLRFLYRDDTPAIDALAVDNPG